MTDYRHPPQREMWEGLTAGGCLSLLGFLAIITVIAEVLK